MVTVSSNETKKIQVHFVPYGTENKPKGEVIYRDPNHPAHTWSGKGRKPLWLQSYLDQGRDLSEFLVPKRRRRKKTNE